MPSRDANRILVVALIAALVGLQACRSGPTAAPPTTALPTTALPTTAQPTTPAGGSIDNALLWLHSSAEYSAVCQTIYRQAREVLLASTGIDGQPAGSRRRAVVMDLDETVLDNSLFNLCLSVHGTKYSQDAWTRWVTNHDGHAALVPGVKAFLASAREASVDVVFISNRLEAKERESTIATLRRLGVVPDSTTDLQLRTLLLLKGDTSGKTARRELAESQFCVIALFGDNLADFAAGYEKRDGFVRQAFERRRLAYDDQALWGTRWFALPNPVYGDWERATTDADREDIRQAALATGFIP